MQKTSASPLSWSVLAVLGGAVVVSPAVPGCAPIKHQEAGDEWEIESIVVGDVLAAVGPEVVEPGLNAVPRVERPLGIDPVLVARAVRPACRATRR